MKITPHHDNPGPRTTRTASHLPPTMLISLPKRIALNHTHKFSYYCDSYSLSSLLTQSATSTRPSVPQSSTMSPSSFDSSDSRSQTPLLQAPNIETTQPTRTLIHSVELLPSHLSSTSMSSSSAYSPAPLLPGRGFGSGALKLDFVGLGF